MAPILNLSACIQVVHRLFFPCRYKMTEMLLGKSVHAASNKATLLLIFFKMGQSRPLFVYFCHFLITISIIEKSIDGVLGIEPGAAGW